MKEKMDINPRILRKIEEYCRLNNIKDINAEINNILQTGLNIILYGTSPFQEVTVEAPSTPVEEPLKPTIETETKPKRGRKKKVETSPILETKQEEIIEEKPIKKTVRIIKTKKDLS